MHVIYRVLLAQPATRMPSYKLIYFNLRGRGELARFVFAQAGVEYHDERVEFKDWPEMKPKMPFEVMPVLEIDGKQMMGGSVVIPRYLAEQFGLAGENALENAQIASIVDTVTDLNQEMLKGFYEKDEKRKEEIRKKFLEETIPSKLPFFEKCACTNDNGWLFNGKLTWADFAFYLSASWMLPAVPDILDPYPGLKRLYASVESLPNIAKWIKERPPSDT